MLWRYSAGWRLRARIKSAWSFLEPMLCVELSLKLPPAVPDSFSTASADSGYHMQRCSQKASASRLATTTLGDAVPIGWAKSRTGSNTAWQLAAARNPPLRDALL